MEKVYKFKWLTDMVKSITALMLVTLLAVGNVFADQVTYVFENEGYENAQEIGSGSINDVISFTTAQNSQTNPPKYYNSGKAARFYWHATKGNAMTLTAANGYVINKVIIQSASGKAPKITVKEGQNASSLLEPSEDFVYTIISEDGAQSIEFMNTGNDSNVQLYVVSLTVEYSESGDAPAVTVDKPTISVPTGTYYSAKTVALACATEGANIYYSINDEEAVLYNAPFTVNETSTITAYAKIGDVQSESATATLTIIIPTELDNIAAFKAAEDDETVIYKIKTDVTYNFGGNRYYYVQDTTGGLLIYNQNNAMYGSGNYNPGDVISGGIIGTRTVYHGLIEMKPSVKPAEGVAGTPILPIVVTMDEIKANPEAFLSKLITIANCKLSEKEFKTTGSVEYAKIFQDGDTMELRNNFKTFVATLNDGQYAYVTGIFGKYDNTLQIYPRTAEDIQIINTALPVSEDFSGEENGNWNIVNGNNVNKWFIGQAQGFDSEKLYISSTNGATNKYNVTSATVSHAWRLVTLPESDVILSFDAKCVGEGNYDYLQVSLLDENESVVAGTLPESYLVRLSGVNEFTHQDILIPASNAGTKKLVFTWRNDNAGGVQTPAAIDNVELKETCTTPTNLTATYENGTATITWEAPEDQEAWTVEYKLSTNNSWTSIDATAKEVTIGELNTNSTYDVRVKANCEESASAWATANFVVPCTDLTISEGNVNIGTGTTKTYYAPTGAYWRHAWVQMIYPASNFESPGYINSISWNVNTAGSHSFTNMKIYLGTTSATNHTSNNQWLSMDELTLVYEASNGTLGATTGWETFELTTPYYYNNDENLVVVVSRTATGYCSYSFGYNSSNNSNAVIYRTNDNDASYAEHPGTSSGSYNSNLPNMKLDFTGYVCGDAVCAAPTNVKVSDVTTNSAAIAWEGDATSYKVAYKAENENEWTVNLAQNTEVTLQNLEQNTNYTVKVSAICDEVGESTESTTTFTTVEACQTPTSITVSHDVENTTISWTPVAGVESYEVQYGINGSNNFETAIVDNASVLIISALNENTQYNVKVRALCGEESTSGWVTKTFTRPVICAAPTQVAVSDVTTNAATVKWNEGDASSWTVEYGVAGFTLGEGTTVNATTNTVTLTGLTPETNYDVYVKGNCHSFLSPWSSKATFSTECAPITITESTPWFEDFEGYIGSGNLPFTTCWETPVKSSSGAPFVYAGSSSFSHSGNYTAELKGYSNQDNVLVLPEFTNDISELQFSFYGNTHATSAANAGVLVVGYVTDAEDGSTFVGLDTITPLATSLNRANSDFYGPFSYADVTAAGARMAIYYKPTYSSYSTMSWNLDDFTVQIIPNCQEPMGLTATSVGYNSATIAWSSTDENANYVFEYGAQGYTAGTGTSVEVDTNVYTIEGLAEITSYDVYVKTVCGAGSESGWVGPYTLTTHSECGYTLNLHDSYGDGWNGGKITLTQGESTQEFTLSSGREATYVVDLVKGVEAKFKYLAGSYAYENSFEIIGPDGTVFWSLSSGSGNDGANQSVTCGETAPQPQGCQKSCEYTVVLGDRWGDGWVGSYSGAAVGSLTIMQADTVVGHYTLDDEYSATHTFELCNGNEIKVILMPDYYGDEMSVQLTDASGNVIWKIEEDELDSWNSNPDPVEFTFLADCGDGPSSCILPTDLVVENVTGVSAELSWTGDTLTSYEVSYKMASATDWTTVTTTGITYTLTGLTANNTYFARVKAVCDVDNTYTNEVMFFATDGVACEETQIGTGTTSANYLPIYSYFNNSHTQQIFKSEEIGEAGNITKLAINYSSSSSFAKTHNVTISLALTDKESFTSTTDWITEGLVEIFSGNFNCVQGWNEFELEQPFAYDGTKNLVVTFHDEGAWESGKNFYITSTTENMSIYWANDSQTWTPTRTGTLYKNRNNIKFTVCPADAGISDVTLTSIENIPNSCDLSNTPITLNFKNIGTNNITTLKAYYKVNNGAVTSETFTLTTPLATGEAAAYTFNTLANLSEDENVVTAWLELAGDANFINNVATSNTVSVVEPMDVPFVEAFANNNNNWSIVDANSDNVKFTFTNGRVSYTYNDTLAANDWLITSCIYVPAGRYEVAYDYNALNANFIENFGVYYGTKNGATYNLNEAIAEHTFSNTNVVTVKNQIEIEQGGLYYFGIHATSAAGNVGFSIDNFSVKPLIRTSIYCADNGTSSPEGIIYVPENEPVTVTITPTPGYHVNAIYKNQRLVRGENGENAAVEYFTYTPNNWDNIYITFAPNKYEINATVENFFESGYNDDALGATYTPMHETLAYGAIHTGIITLMPYYHLESVTVNGLNVISDLEELGNSQYKLTLSPIAEDKDIKVVACLDSAKIIYTVLGGQGTINNTFVVNDDTEIPAVYTETMVGFGNLLSTITPAIGYHVESIIIDGVEHNNIEEYSFEHIIGVHTVNVTFAKNHYVINTNAFGNGTVSAGNSFDYDPEYVYVFKATPTLGNHIVSVTRNGEELAVANPEEMFTDTLRNILMDYNYNVLFAANFYTISAVAGEHGSITNPGATNYNYNSNATYTITAENGYYISSVVIDGEETTYTQDNALTTYTYTFSGLTGNHQIEATFAPFVYTITVEAGQNGTIEPGTNTYYYNATPTFTITPSEGYSIVDVKVDNVSIGAVNTYTFTPLTSSHTISATFGANQYTITANAGNGGTISNPGVTNMAYGASKTYTITASTGYHIENVYVDGAAVGAVSSYTFTDVDANHTIYAVFAINTYTITVTQPDHGTITPSGVITVEYGATPSFVFTPHVGYKVTQITVNTSTQVIGDATHVNDIYTYTFPAIDGNKTLKATMAPKTYTITATAGTNGTITPSGTATYNYGVTKTYTFTPSEGYVVEKVTVDGMNMGAPTSYTFVNIVANHTINVTFAQKECVAPSNLFANYIDRTSAVLNWYHPSSEVTFDIQYKVGNGLLNSITAVSGNNYTLMGLTPGTTYLWQVRANCSANNHSDWTNMSVFTTYADPTVGVEDFDASQIKVYAERQNIHIVNNSGANAESVRVYDMYGKLLYQGNLNTQHEVININVAAGTYVVNVATEKGFCNYKVTIVR